MNKCIEIYVLPKIWFVVEAKLYFICSWYTKLSQIKQNVVVHVHFEEYSEFSAVIKNLGKITKKIKYQPFSYFFKSQFRSSRWHEQKFMRTHTPHPV